MYKIGRRALDGALMFTGLQTAFTSFRFGTDGDEERVVIDSSGRLGIGVTGPVRKLVVSNNGAEGVEFGPGESTGINEEVHFNRSTAQYVSKRVGASEHIFNSPVGEAARIDSSGRLLVGTSTSRQVTIGESPDWNPLVQVTKTGTDGGNIAAYSWSTYNTSTGGGQGIGPDIVLARSNSNTEGTHVALTTTQLLGRITFNGSNGSAFAAGAYIAATADDAWASGDHPTRLVFSTTADGASSPTERMRIRNEGGAWIYGDPAGVTVWSASNRTSGSGDFVFCGSHSATGTGTGTVTSRIATNGDVTNTNNSYGAISDIKLKENIVEAPSQWADLKTLQIRKYNFKEETGQDTHTQIGLIAQEVELVSPGLVSESPDRDEDGNDLGTVTKSVNYSVLYMKAVKALQEAMERIETLEAKVAALETK